jgi:hypothetical protein
LDLAGGRVGKLASARDRNRADAPRDEGNPNPEERNPNFSERNPSQAEQNQNPAEQNPNSKSFHFLLRIVRFQGITPNLGRHRALALFLSWPFRP